MKFSEKLATKGNFFDWSKFSYKRICNIHPSSLNIGNYNCTASNGCSSDYWFKFKPNIEILPDIIVSLTKNSWKITQGYRVYFLHDYILMFDMDGLVDLYNDQNININCDKDININCDKDLQTLIEFHLMVNKGIDLDKITWFAPYKFVKKLSNLLIVKAKS